MQITNLQSLKIHQFQTEEQYSNAIQNNKINANDLCLTPFDADNFVPQSQFQALVEEVNLLKTELDSALTRIIEIQQAYIDGIPVHFFVGAVQCEYEIGMTWNDWIESPYHKKVQPDEFERWMIQGDSIRNIGDEILYAVHNGEQIVVKPSDKVGIYKHYMFTYAEPEPYVDPEEEA